MKKQMGNIYFLPLTRPSDDLSHKGRGIHTIALVFALWKRQRPYPNSG